MFQWIETGAFTPSRGVRGGAWDSTNGNLVASYTGSNLPPTFVDDDIGFRVAEVPEPGSFALLAIGAAGLLLWARRRKAA